MKYKLYMAVTPDKYELPLAVFDNLGELSTYSNKRKSNLSDSISNNREDKKLHCRYVKVDLSNMEEI